MGDPKRIRKKYETPSHPWIKSRIEEDSRIRKTYVTGNKKEIWRMESVLKNFKTQAKKFIVLDTPQSKVETQQLFKKIKELGLLQDVSFDSILGLTIDNMMDRRLQTIVFKKGLARSMKQARQFIVHEHIVINGAVITSPNYLVRVKEESSIGFSTSSPMFSEQHPERASQASEEESTDDATKAKSSAKEKVDAKKEKKEAAKKEENVDSKKASPETTKKVDSKKSEATDSKIDSKESSKESSKEKSADKKDAQDSSKKESSKTSEDVEAAQ